MAAETSGSNSRLVAIGAVVLLVGVILVLLILRGTVGGDEPAATPGDTGQGDAGQGTAQTDAEVEAAQQDTAQAELVSGDEDRAARVRLPLDIPEGQEAVTVQASFARGAAALPTAGDRVVAYRIPDAEDAEDGDGDAGDDASGADASGADASGDGAPATAADAERVLEDLEILGVIGPRPAANDGTLTVVLAVDEADVPALLPVARDRALWLTLLPTADGDASGDDGSGDVADGEGDAEALGEAGDA